MIKIAILAPVLALRVGLREIFRSIEEVEVVVDTSSTQEIPAVDVLVMTAPDYLSDLNDEAPAVLLLTDDLRAAAYLMETAVWGILSLNASVEELSAAIHALAEGLWIGSPVLVQNLLERYSVSDIEDVELVANLLTEREGQYCNWLQRVWPINKLPWP